MQHPNIINMLPTDSEIPRDAETGYLLLSPEEQEYLSYTKGIIERTLRRCEILRRRDKDKKGAIADYLASVEFEDDTVSEEELPFTDQEITDFFLDMMQSPRPQEE